MIILKNVPALTENIIEEENDQFYEQLEEGYNKLNKRIILLECCYEM